MKTFPVVVALAGLTVSVATACSPPRPESERTAASASPLANAGSEQGTFEGSPLPALLVNAHTTDFGGELSARVPPGWIAQRAIAPGYQLFTSRDGRVVVAVHETEPGADATAAASPFPTLPIRDLALGAAREIKLGRSGLPASYAYGACRVAEGRGRVYRAGLDRATSVGPKRVLLHLAIADDASAQDRDRGFAILQSVGTR